jgi:hypothetical protein
MLAYYIKKNFTPYYKELARRILLDKLEIIVTYSAYARA